MEPEGVLGGDTLHGVLIVTTRLEDQDDVTPVFVAHRACALTLYMPAELHDFDALVDELQVENVPSPQSKRYWTLCPAAQVELPVE